MLQCKLGMCFFFQLFFWFVLFTSCKFNREQKERLSAAMEYLCFRSLSVSCCLLFDGSISVWNWTHTHTHYTVTQPRSAWWWWYHWAPDSEAPWDENDVTLNPLNRSTLCELKHFECFCLFVSCFYGFFCLFFTQKFRPWLELNLFIDLKQLFSPNLCFRRVHYSVMELFR